MNPLEKNKIESKQYASAFTTLGSTLLAIAGVALMVYEYGIVRGNIPGVYAPLYQPGDTLYLYIVGRVIFSIPIVAVYGYVVSGKYSPAAVTIAVCGLCAAAHFFLGIYTYSSHYRSANTQGVPRNIADSPIKCCASAIATNPLNLCGLVNPDCTGYGNLTIDQLVIPSSYNFIILTHIAYFFGAIVMGIAAYFSVAPQDQIAYFYNLLTGDKIGQGYDEQVYGMDYSCDEDGNSTGTEYAVGVYGDDGDDGNGYGEYAKGVSTSSSLHGNDNYGMRSSKVGVLKPNYDHNNN